MPKKSCYDTSCLKRLIEEKYVVHKKFANKIGISEYKLSDLLNGRRDFDRDTIVLFANALEIRPSQYHIYFFSKASTRCET